MSFFRLFALCLFVLATARRVETQDTAAGLKAEIIGVTMVAGRHPEVTFKIGDEKGRPLELDELDRESIKFTIAVLKIGSGGQMDYRNYILSHVVGKEFVYKGEARKPALAETLQPGSDKGGVFKRLKPGVFSYTFTTALPADYDARATHVVGAELTRGNRRYAANPLYEFVPAGGKVQRQRELPATASCNTCHDPLRAHGGTARQLGYCALCHTAQLMDAETGENLDLKYFLHKIHRGGYLPSVKAGKPYITVATDGRIADFGR